MSKQIKILFIIIGICLLALIAGTYYLTTHFTNTTPVPKVPPSKSAEASAPTTLVYKDITYGFIFNYPYGWRFLVLREDLDCCGKIIFFPQTSSIDMYNQLLNKGGTSASDLAETIAPISINISRILSNDVGLTQLMNSNCGNQTLCDPNLATDIQVARLSAKSVILKHPFDGKAVFLIKSYTGSAPSGKYLFNISVRLDRQTQKLYDIGNIKGAFDAAVSSFKFIY